MDVLSDENHTDNSSDSGRSVTSDFILDSFFEDPEGSAAEHEKLVRFFNLVIKKDQPESEEDCDRLDAFGVEFSK